MNVSVRNGRRNRLPTRGDRYAHDVFIRWRGIFIFPHELFQHCRLLRGRNQSRGRYYVSGWSSLVNAFLLPVSEFQSCREFSDGVGLNTLKRTREWIAAAHNSARKCYNLDNVSISLIAYTYTINFYMYDSIRAWFCIWTFNRHIF